ncbi:MAG TPA: alkaline phosphatase family protein [Thermoanaerobaculia bacterium]|nr:alkaline phosphatase family protein [Thermoanaerobaculia bacterium]
MRCGPRLASISLLVPLAGAFGCGGENAVPSRAAAPEPRAAAETPVESSDVASRTRRPASSGPRRSVIWIGLDGLDFEILDRLAGSGAMPHWKRLASEGWTARLSSDYPLISPVLWTTAATGRTPDAHRVLDFQEVDPATGRKVPISGLSRAVPAVWNLASAAGRKVGVVGWWATHPAEEVDGFFVSDRVSPMLFEAASAAGAVYPVSLQDGVAKAAARESRVAAADLAPYLGVPESEIARALESGGGMKDPVVALSRIVGATRATQRIARELYDRTLPDLTAVYFEGTDEVGHVFAPFSPPRVACPSVADGDVARYARVAETYYVAMDSILGQWMRRAEEDGAVLIVSSDHGFKWGEDRPCGFASGDAATAAFWHRPEGVLAAWGSGVKPAPRSAASQMDVAPTVLALLELPLSRAMPGAARVDAFDGVKTAARSDAPAAEVRRVSAAEASPRDADEYAKKLLALGYLSAGQPSSLPAPGGARPGMTEGAWNNLGTYEMRTRHDANAARAAFQKALELAPGYAAPMFNLAVLARDRGEGAAAETWLLKAIAALKADPGPAVSGWAHEYERRGQEAAAKSLLARAAREYPDSEAIARERALMLQHAGDCKTAAAALAPFESKTTSAQTLNDLALIQTCLQDRAAVERLLARSLELDPNQPAVAQALERVRRAD